MPTFYCNYYFLLGTRGPLTLGGPLDFAYPAYPIVTPLMESLYTHVRHLMQCIHEAIIAATGCSDSCVDLCTALCVRGFWKQNVLRTRMSNTLQYNVVYTKAEFLSLSGSDERPISSPMQGTLWQGEIMHVALSNNDGIKTMPPTFRSWMLPGLKYVGHL